MSEVMIEARDLTKSYGSVRALDGIELQVRRGEVLGFLGPNGAGKTTTMKILTCFTAPTSGTAVINGSDVFDDPLGVRRSIGYLPEHNPLYLDMMVGEYLEFIAELRGLPRSERRKHIKAAVEETGLRSVYGRVIRTLSKGYRQRVGLAQALVHRPPILILDEPMSGLDPNQAVEIRDLIRDLGKERTVILSTHHLAEVQATCSRVSIIARGRIVADDSPERLQDRAGKPRYLLTLCRPEGASPDGVRARLAQVTGVDVVHTLSTESQAELRFEALPSGDEDLRPRLFHAVVEAGYTLLELRKEGQNLEEIFRQLTLDEPSSPTPTSDTATPAAA